MAVKGAQFRVSQSSRGVSEGAVSVQEEEGVPAPVSHPALPRSVGTRSLQQLRAPNQLRCSHRG